MVELREYHLEYQPRTVINNQVLADFVAELTLPERVGETEPDISKWKLYVDDSSIGKCNGARMIVVTPDQITLNSATQFGFRPSNNEAKYAALLVSLRLLKLPRAKKISIFSYSRLVVNQVNQQYQAKEENMISYFLYHSCLLY